VTLITVREYARLTTSHVEASSLDRQQISQSAFDWICKLNATISSSGAALIQLDNRQWLRLDNYVGVIETPCGTRIEILPKHFHEGEPLDRSRSLLVKMITAALDLKSREVGAATLQTFNAPLNEWVIAQFLSSLDHLIKRGIRSEYRTIEEEQRFLRGQLHRVRQMRQRPDRQHFFHIRHDVFSADRAENRLLKLALERACRVTQVASSWRLSHELRGYLAEVEASQDVVGDFQSWRDDRLMTHYRSVKPWCELILNEKMAKAVVGRWEGVSLLFPMEKLFERYVASCLRRSLSAGVKMRIQPREHFLCEHDGRRVFCLEPDIVVERDSQKWILDTKWKLLNGTDTQNNYGLKQTDFYQLLAYGATYLRDTTQGKLGLIYPRREPFNKPLPAFSIVNDLELWVFPFDVASGTLIHQGRVSDSFFA
jgi:5-methylcytosine-specific restriction enzyme subunit McrC